MSVFNSVQNYGTLKLTKRIYSAPNAPVTSLSARTFGTWTFQTAIIRFYAAYHLSDPVVYQLALSTFVIAFGHFASEWMVFGTARWGAGLASPVAVSTTTVVWMLLQWGWYVR